MRCVILHSRTAGWVCWLGLLLGIVPEPARGGAGPTDLTSVLRVVVVPSKTTVRYNQPFAVSLRVENPTTTGHTLRVMSCSWNEHWQTSNTNLSWRARVCDKNVPTTVRLPPGGAYTNQLEMFLVAPVNDQTLSFSFQMGFTPLDQTRPIWSDAVVLNVDPKPGDDVFVMTDPSSTRGALEAALAYLNRGSAPVVLKNQTAFQSAAQVLPELQKVAERPILATTEYKNWLWFATDVVHDSQTQTIRTFLGGYAVRKGSHEVLKWGVW